MKNIVISSLLIFCFGCKAQTTISLEQAYQYRQTENGIPETVQYVNATQDCSNFLTTLPTEKLINLTRQ